MSPLVVQRRLKLANVSPRLMADYRASGVTLEQLMALTITDDHAAQEAAFYGAPEWQRSPSKLRERLTEREIDAAHALVRFVGLNTYRQAGGGIRRDLFAEGDAGTYLTDTAVLETLVRDKLATLAEDVRAEGWAWVEAVPHLAYEERQAFQNAPRHRREPTSREARRIASLESRLEKIDAELEEACDAEDEAKAEKLEQRRDQVVGELQDAEDALQGYAPRCARWPVPSSPSTATARPLFIAAAARSRGWRCARWKSCGAVSATPKAKPPTTSTRTPTTHPRPRACPIGWRSG